MGAWWISWIDFPFSCRKIYILLTCYVTVTEASKQVKCIRWTWLPYFFLSQENSNNPGPRLDPRLGMMIRFERRLGLWLGRPGTARCSPDCRCYQIRQILRSRHLHTSHHGWWPGPPSSLSSSIIVVGTGPGSRVGVDGCWVRSVSCISRD